MNIEAGIVRPDQELGKFEDPDWTANGERRASVSLEKLETLWINTGTVCNIECVNCYIESSPTNDRLVYITSAEVATYLDEIEAMALGTSEIGFTGGEPFMNPAIIAMVGDALSRSHRVLVLTNGMQPMQRPRIKMGLLQLKDQYADRLTIRVSLDHYSRALHEKERGGKTWEKALKGLDWLSKNGFRVAIAGRTCWGEDETRERQGYAHLIARRDWAIDPSDDHALVLLPEMDESVDVPEITTACWNILRKSPSDIMCSASRMVVKRKGHDKPSVLPCTIIPYDEAFGMGATLQEALQRNGGMFRRGAVKLCHPNCAKFCVLGGGSCS